MSEKSFEVLKITQMASVSPKHQNNIVVITVKETNLIIGWPELGQGEEVDGASHVNLKKEEAILYWIASSQLQELTRPCFLTEKFYLHYRDSTSGC